MNWTSPTLIGWYYRIHETNGSVSPWKEYDSFVPPKIQNHYFDAGIFYVGSGNHPSGDAFFYQFGVSSARIIANQSWHVLFKCPELVENGAWQCISHASFIGGQYAYWKVWYTFGIDYQGVSFAYLQNYTVDFHYSGNASPSDGTVMW